MSVRILQESTNSATNEDNALTVSSSTYGSINEEESLILSTYKVYKRRFYIVFLFSFFGLMQAAIWNTWGPISETASKVYGWDNTNMALLPNWGAIMMMISFFPMIQLLLRFGLRFTTLHCSFLLFLGTGLRCIPGSILWKTIAAHTCAILTGYCEALAMIAPTALTVVWFPPDERTTSTAVMTLSNNNVAVGFSFIFARVMVSNYNVTATTGPIGNKTEYISMMSHDLDNFMYFEFVLCTVLFLLILVYFPKKPPTPPSSSAVLQRTDFKRGAAMAFKSKNFWMVLLSFAISAGVQIAFISVFNETLYAYNISQDDSNWLGFYWSVIGIPGGFCFSLLADCQKRRMKMLLMLAILGSGISYAWFALICFGVLPSNLASLYISILLGGFFSNGTLPLFFEFSCEISYPVSEEVVTGLLSAAYNVVCGLFLGLVMIKQLGTAWIPTTVAMSFFVCLPMLFFMKAEFRRLFVDADDNIACKEKDDADNEGSNFVS